MMILKLSSLLGSVAIASSRYLHEKDGRRSLQQCAAIEVGATPMELPLGNSHNNCFKIVAGDDASQQTQPVRLTIITPTLGYYSFFTPFNPVSPNSNKGCSQRDSDGIYYCADVGDVFNFEEFPPTNDNGNDPIVSISAEVLSEGEICTRDAVSYNGYVPLETPDNGDTTEIFWSDHRYYLSAAHFEYSVKADGETVTMKNANHIEIGGDPGDDEYISIEIIWYDESEIERRFNGYIHGDATSWAMDEARVYNNEIDWAYFEHSQGDDTKGGDDVLMGQGGIALRGQKEECFKADNMIIINEEGDMIKFEKMTLATFLPWSDEEKFLECVHGTGTTSAMDTEAPSTPTAVMGSKHLDDTNDACTIGLSLSLIGALLAIVVL